mmetsp:Transcript_119443/g.381014  ORF Transcript_119443/g.381014 Transcript_119443/m.381014 type:complete len:205 (+) Transcript_119443:1176-1790(+)
MSRCGAPGSCCGTASPGSWLAWLAAPPLQTSWRGSRMAPACATSSPMPSMPGARASSAHGASTFWRRCAGGCLPTSCCRSCGRGRSLCWMSGRSYFGLTDRQSGAVPPSLGTTSRAACLLAPTARTCCPCCPFAESPGTLLGELVGAKGGRPRVQRMTTSWEVRRSSSQRSLCPPPSRSRVSRHCCRAWTHRLRRAVSGPCSLP